MIAPRLAATAAAGFFAAVGLLSTAGTAAAQDSTDRTVPPSSTEPPDTVGDVSPLVSCVLVDSDVEADTATFTIGPDGCSSEVGPISFSTYALPAGQIMPYEDQVLIAHAEGNGSLYTAGSYTLHASLGEAAYWQADLYYGQSDDQPPHPDMIDVDAFMAATVPTTPDSTAPETTAPETTAAPARIAPPTTAPAVTYAPIVPAPVVESQVVAPSPTAPPISVEVEANANVTVVVAPAAAVAQQPTTTTTTTTTTTPQTLPRTGGSDSTPALLAAGGAMSVVGLGARRLARRH